METPRALKIANMFSAVHNGKVEVKPPYVYTHSESVDPPEDWQVEDIEYMYDHFVSRGYAANWSEMGCKKTSTGLWAIQRLWREHWGEDYKPNVWICTTRSGKGTFFNLAPHILEGWYIFNVTSQGIFIIQDGKQVKLKLDIVPEKFDMPTLVVTHFNIFSRSNRGKFMEVNGMPITGKDGAMVMMPWTPADHFVAREWDLCWIDEAHRIKNKDTKWTVIMKRSKDFMRMDTTGTGFINKPDEIWSLLNHMISAKNISFEDPATEVVKGFFDFRDEFCIIDDYEGFEKVIGVRPERKDEFRALVRSFGPRRTLTEVMPHIKEPIFVRHPVDLNPTQRRMYNDIKLELQALDQEGAHINVTNILSLLLRLRMVCTATPRVVSTEYDSRLDRTVQKIELVEPSSKIDAVMDILDGLEWDEERKDPVVIFSNFVDPIKLLQARFNRANANAMEMGFPPEYPYLWMKESHDDQQRYEMWKPGGLFESGEYRVFMSTLQLGGESISLTSARHLIFLDRSWSPKDNLQGIGRIRRPGQEGQPIVINIEAEDTIDSYVKAVNDLKHDWFREIFGNS